MDQHILLHSSGKAANPDENPSGELDKLRSDRPGAMPYEMAPALHPYVLLNFSSNSEVACKSLPLAVVFRQNTVPIIIIRHNWQVSLDAKDRDYLSELLDDWMRTPPERVLALFRELECLSAGPITTTAFGIATAESLDQLMYAVLERAGVLG